MTQQTEADRRAAKEFLAARYYFAVERAPYKMDEDLAQAFADHAKAERDEIVKRGLAFCNYLDTIHSSAGALARGFFIDGGHRKDRT